jgi:hypothetical protein
MDFLLKPFRRFSLKRTIGKITNGVETNLLDDFLQLLLKAVQLILRLDRKYRRNIEGFNARYAFQSRDGKIAASAIFANDKMKVEKRIIPDTNVTVIFKDGKSLWEFLMAKNPDVFAFLLENKLSWEGNINYLLKFAYMAKHLQVKYSI